MRKQRGGCLGLLYVTFCPFYIGGGGRCFAPQHATKWPLAQGGGGGYTCYPIPIIREPPSQMLHLSILAVAIQSDHTIVELFSRVISVISLFYSVLESFSTHSYSESVFHTLTLMFAIVLPPYIFVFSISGFVSVLFFCLFLVPHVLKTHFLQSESANSGAPSWGRSHHWPFDSRRDPPDGRSSFREFALCVFWLFSKKISPEDSMDFSVEEKPKAFSQVQDDFSSHYFSHHVFESFVCFFSSFVSHLKVFPS